MSAADVPLAEDQARALGLRLQALRHRVGRTQERVAADAGLSRNHYQLLERGLSDRAHGTPANPRLSTLISLSVALDTSVAELLADIVYPGTDTPIVSVWHEESGRGR